MTTHPSASRARVPKAPVSIELDHDRNRDRNRDRVCRRVDDRSVSEIVIQWRVSRRSLTQLQLKGNSPIVTLTLTLKPDSDHRASPIWTLIDPSSKDQLVIEQAHLDEPICISHDPPHTHLQSTNFRAIITESDLGTCTLVYVRTSIFNQLQIPGGRYEPQSATIRA